ncbi:conserved hypothetical protein [Solidesulfovibrio fructosivorans JJ]]|uniref:Uncharacterized protein n=1 Tax=Solidesulfovibrio fructosivorans JJ] TaxID=596151 RepID=E1JS98_SOLFR|nr:hypothetical protein [Solidesulfovibrio fructosivorans]EFL52867.1 conserved hypothetical protein [Solidesulfovibrio fructosivorans JJ]]
MLPFFGSKSEKDIGERLLGKPRRFRLPRHGAAVTVHGRLVAFFRREHEPDGLMPPAPGRVELIALFVTRAGRYLAYYVVAYPETEDIAGRHEYIHVLENLTSVRTFLAAMHYPNRFDFADRLVGQALATLEGVQAKGKKVVRADDGIETLAPVPTPAPTPAPIDTTAAVADTPDTPGTPAPLVAGGGGKDASGGQGKTF